MNGYLAYRRLRARAAQAVHETAGRVAASAARLVLGGGPRTIPRAPERILAVIGKPGSGVSMRKEFILEATVPVGPWPKVRDALRSLLESLA